MEGRDALFGDMLESISQKVETAESKDSKAKDPLKTKSPKELKGDGKKDTKLQKMGEREESKETKTEEGIDPTSDKKGDYGQDEAEKIKKLTEGEDVAEEVKSLITKAKEALDSGDYIEAQDLVSRLSQVKAAVSEPEEVETEPGNTGLGMPAVDVDDGMEESKVNESEDIFYVYSALGQRYGGIESQKEGTATLPEIEEVLQEESGDLENDALRLVQGAISFNPDLGADEIINTLKSEGEVTLEHEEGGIGISRDEKRAKELAKIGYVDDEMEESKEDHSEFIMDDNLQEMIDTALDSDVEFKIDEAKKDPKAKTRNRGDVVFPAESPKVKDDKDHFPINSEKQARNALARANQYKSSPKWYDGSLKTLVTKVANAVKKKYKGIEVSKEAKTPGKG